MTKPQLTKISPSYYPIELLHWSGMQDTQLPYVQDILEEHPEYINTLNNEKDNALMIAIRVGNEAIAHYFLEHTAIDTTHLSTEGNFFMVALRYQGVEFINNLLDKHLDKIDFNQKTTEGKFFLVALQHSSRAVIQFLWNNHKDKIDYYDTTDVQRKNLYHIAAQKGYDFIFEDTIHEDMIAQLDANGQTCLFDSIANYNYNKNFLCFDYIQESMSDSIMAKNNNVGQNALTYFYLEVLPNLSFTINPHTQEALFNKVKNEAILHTYAPIINIIEQRLAPVNNGLNG